MLFYLIGFTCIVVGWMVGVAIYKSLSPFHRPHEKDVWRVVNGKTTLIRFVSWDKVHWYEYRLEGKSVKIRGRNRKLMEMFDKQFLDDFTARGPRPPVGGRGPSPRS